MVTAMSVSAGTLQIRQQGRGLLWRQGKQRAIKEHILRPLLAAAQDEFGAADAFRGSGLINQLALLGRGPQLQHLIASHDPPLWLS
jgi:hypothetical protein